MVKYGEVYKNWLLTCINKRSQMSSSQGVLFLRVENGELNWFENGNEDSDGKYIGEIKNGKPNGQGTYTFPDGKKYVGKFKDGKKHGQGTTTYSTGIKYVGEFKYDTTWKGTFYDINGNIVDRVVNGNWIKQ